MALHISFPPPGLANNEKLIGTRVKIYEDREKSRLKYTTDETTSPLSLVRDPGLTINQTYYVEGAYILEPGGLQAFSPLVEFTVTDNNDITLDALTPMDKPRPYITMREIDEESQHTLLHFDIGFTGKVYPIKTISWVLKDSNGDIVDYILNSGRAIHFETNALLLPSKVYTITALVTLTNNVSSFPISKTFYTAKYYHDGFSFDKNRFDAGDFRNTKVYFNLENNHNVIRLEVLDEGGIVNSHTFSGDYIDVAQYIDVTANAVMRFISIDNDGVERGPLYFYHFIDSSSMLPSGLPYNTREE